MTISLKNKIEQEIEKIDKLYQKTVDEITKSFVLKHEKLIKEENDLKENLQNEVTKVKEKLEKYWSQSNNEIKLNEKLNQGLKQLKNKENNIITNISYISKLNKNQKEMAKLIINKIGSLTIKKKKEM